MSFLIDTNVISEITRPNPDPRVVSFLHETDEDRLFVSVITLGELRRGVALKADGRAKSALDAWLRLDLREDLPAGSSMSPRRSPTCGGN